MAKRITADEFEARHAEQRGVSIAELRAEGRLVKPCDCDYVGCEGWQWVSREQALREEGLIRDANLFDLAGCIDVAAEFERSMCGIKSAAEMEPADFARLSAQVEEMAG
jgi:hypothetical protein